MTKLAPALDAAITYAAHGLKPFPIKARSKTPATAHGFKDATLDGGVLHRRFTAAGVDANVGIATGGGIIVVDLDGMEAQAWANAFTWPHTWIATSGRADGGRHYYFKVDRPVATRPQGTNGIGPKVDVKGEGGYVVAPPSVHPDGPTYAWSYGGPGSSIPIAAAPAWLMALLDEPRRATAPASTQNASQVVTDGQDDHGARQAAGYAARGMPRPEARAALEAMVATRFAGGWAGLDSARPWTRDDVERWLDGAYAKFYDPGAPKLAAADERLRERAAAKSATQPKAPRAATLNAAPAADVDVIGTLASDIEAKAVRWLWRGRLPAGMLVILDGDPGLGKSTIVADWIGRVTRGDAWPDGEPCERGGAIYVGAEDPAPEVIIPRLRAAGADLSMVRVVTTIPTADGHERLPILPKDLAVFERAITATRARLLVFDPIISYVAAELSSYSDKDVRQALTPLADMLAGTGCTGVMLRHLKKDDKASLAMYRGGGSIAFIAVARAGFAVSKVKGEDGATSFMPTKANLAPKAKSLRYSLETVDLGGGLETSRVLWGAETDDDPDVNMTAFGTLGDKPRAKAEELIQEFLLKGPRPSAALEAEADARGVAQRTLRRAKDEVGVRARMVGEAWWVALPEHARELAEVGAVRAADGRLYSAGGRGTSFEREPDSVAVNADGHVANAADGGVDAVPRARARAQEGIKSGHLNSNDPKEVAIRPYSGDVGADGQSATLPLTRACGRCGEAAGSVRRRGVAYCAACGAPLAA